MATTPSAAHGVFKQLMNQVGMVRLEAAAQQANGNDAVAFPLQRSCLVLAVAALDTFLHERGVGLLLAHGTAAGQAAVCGYTGVTAQNLGGLSAAGHLRLKLSYKTLVAPSKIDDLFVACGLDPAQVWLDASISRATRPDRLRGQLQLLFDRRNQIAHEGDWDPAALDFRLISDGHVADAVACVETIVDEFDHHLP